MIELAPTPNLDTPAVYNWILHDPANAVFNGPVPAEPGMVQADRRDFTPATTDTTGRPLVIFAAQKEHYNIFRHRKFLASFDADILIEQAIRVCPSATRSPTLTGRAMRRPSTRKPRLVS